MRPMVVGIAVMVTGCAYGGGLEEYPVVGQPGGARLTLELAREQVTGELVEVRDSALVLVRSAQPRIVFVPFRGVVRGRFDGEHRPAPSFRGTPSASVLERMRLLSRYPQGLSPELEERLLAAYGQAEFARPGG